MFVLRAEIVIIFEPKMVTISARNTNIYKIFIMFFLAVVFDSLLFTYSRLKFSLTCKLSIDNHVGSGNPSIFFFGLTCKLSLGCNFSRVNVVNHHAQSF